MLEYTIEGLHFVHGPFAGSDPLAQQPTICSPAQATHHRSTVEEQ